MRRLAQSALILIAAALAFSSASPRRARAADPNKGKPRAAVKPAGPAIAETPVGSATNPTPRAVPLDAVTIALSDAVGYQDAIRRQYVRYIWTVENTAIRSHVVSFIANTAISRSAVPFRAIRVGDGSVVRLDFYDLVPDAAERLELLAEFDRLAARDPYFYVRGRVKVTVPRYRATDGQTYDYVYKDATAFGGHILAEYGVQLNGLIRTTATPIARWDHFQNVALSNLDGGRYYEFAGIKASPDPKVTDFDFFLSQSGIDRKIVDKLAGAERRAIRFVSDVTDTSRRIEERQGPVGVVVWTEDFAKGKGAKKSELHVARNLLGAAFDGSEAISQKGNGFCRFAAFDGKGKLVREVPGDIATDDVPHPKDDRLTPGVSCVRCHKIKDGFRTIENDALALLRPVDEGGKIFDVFADLSEPDRRVAFDRIASSYRDNLSRLNRARLDYSAGVFRATGLTVDEISSAVKSADDAYRFATVGPVTACRELGVDAGDDAKAAARTLTSLLPPVTLPDGRSIRDDPILTRLKRGGDVTRTDWEAVYADAAVRSMGVAFSLTRPWTKQGGGK